MECLEHNHHRAMTIYFLQETAQETQTQYKAKMLLVVLSESIIYLAIITVLRRKMDLLLSNLLVLHQYQLVQCQILHHNNHTLLIPLILRILLVLIQYPPHHPLELHLCHLQLTQCQWHLLLHLFLLNLQRFLHLQQSLGPDRARLSRVGDGRRGH